ncbi:MAG: AsmA family protein, partial [Puniceicoccales bacterium]|nr:AsmA family protein [Puniceicoccales bacterium]
MLFLTHPAVQRGYVLRLLHTSGIPAEIGAAHIGLSGAVSFENATLDLPEGRVSCQRGSAKLDWFSLLWDGDVDFETLKLDGVKLDLSQKRPARVVHAKSAVSTPAADKPAAVGAVAGWSSYITNAEITDGSVILPNGDAFSFSVQIPEIVFMGELSSASFKSSKIQLFATGAAAPFADFTANNKLLVQRYTADHWSFSADTFSLALEKCPLTLLNALFPAAAVPDWRVTGGTITTVLAGVDTDDATLCSSGDSTRLDALSLSRHGQPWLQGISSEILFILQFEKAKATWTLHVQEASLLTGGLPLLDGTGEFVAVNGTDEKISFNATATVHGDGLAVQPAWKDTLAKFSGEGWRGNFVLKGQLSPAADGTDHTPRLLLTDASVTAARGESVPLLRAELLQDFDSASPVATDGTPFLRVSAESFPLPLATPFLDGVQLGGVADGTVELTQTDKRLRVATAEKTVLTLKDFSYTDADGSLWLDGFHLQSGVALAFDAANAADGLWELNFVGSKVDAGDGRTLAGDVALAWDGTGFRSFRAQLEGDPARLLRQPLLGGFSNLASARLVFDGTYTRGGTFGVAFTLANIAGADGLATLRKVTLNAAGTEEKTLSLTAATATLEGETRTSDLTLAGQGAFTLESAQLDLADIERLAVLFAPHPPAVAAVGAVAASAPSSVPSPQKPSVPSAAKPDKKPFWHSLCELGVETFSAKVDAVHVSPLVFGAVAADGKVQPDALVLEKFFARVADGTAGGQARLDFRPTAPTAPYALDASASLRALPFKSSIALLAPSATDTV